MKVLIVEDDQISLQLLKKMIESWGHEVIPASNGLDAWDIFTRNDDVKFVIADWMMPGLDGIALCRRIREKRDTGYVYFILLTGRNHSEDVITGLDAGADDYVTKPFERDELRFRVRAGERILKLEKELLEKNNALSVLNAKLEALASIDPLMEISNRRCFYSVMEQVHSSACRYNQAYSLVICDIDNFKHYNDIYGHLAGDHILRTIARTIQDSLRTCDQVFRYGGEEIVVLLAGQNKEAAFITAERMRQNVEMLGLEHSGSTFGIVTLSFGVASFVSEAKQCQWEDVLECADVALYQAKGQGKNQGAIYDEHPSVDHTSDGCCAL